MRVLLTALTLALLAPAVSATHWTDDYFGTPPVGDSTCVYTDTDCVLLYLCTGGAPPQAVDLAIYCAERASDESIDVINWVPFFAWVLADEYTEQAEQELGTAHSATAGTTDALNTILCNQVWSGFCEFPVEVPEHAPVDDPVGPYPG